MSIVKLVGYVDQPTHRKLREYYTNRVQIEAYGVLCAEYLSKSAEPIQEDQFNNSLDFVLFINAVDWYIHRVELSLDIPWDAEIEYCNDRCNIKLDFSAEVK